MIQHVLYSDTLSLRLLRRLASYSAVGTATFLLDLLIIAALVYGIGAGYQLAVVVGFLIAISVNFFICYHVVYKGTEQSLLRGFVVFLAIAALGSLLIAYSVEALVEVYAMAVLVARTLVSVLVGLLNFLLNTFFNFRLF